MIFKHGVIGNVSALGAGVMGSSPIVLKICIAQSVEQRAFNSEVLGSSPSAYKSLKKLKIKINKIVSYNLCI